MPLEGARCFEGKGPSPANLKSPVHWRGLRVCQISYASTDSATARMIIALAATSASISLGCAYCCGGPYRAADVALAADRAEPRSAAAFFVRIYTGRNVPARRGTDRKR